MGEHVKNTCVDELREIRIGREEEDDIVEWDGADEVEEEPSLEIMDGDQPWVEDDLVGEIIGNNSCRII